MQTLQLPFVPRPSRRDRRNSLQLLRQTALCRGGPWVGAFILNESGVLGDMEPLGAGDCARGQERWSKPKPPSGCLEEQPTLGEGTQTNAFSFTLKTSVFPVTSLFFLFPFCLHSGSVWWLFLFWGSWQVTSCTWEGSLLEERVT